MPGRKRLVHSTSSVVHERSRCGSWVVLLALLVVVAAPPPPSSQLLSSVEQCKEVVIQQLQDSCADVTGPGASSSELLTDVLNSYVAQCLHCPNATTSLLQLLAPSHLLGWVQRQASSYQQLTGVTVNVSAADFSQIPDMVQLAMGAGAALQHAWLVDGASMPALAAKAGGLLRLDALLGGDPNVQWFDVHPTWRALAAYDNQTVGLPLDGDLTLLYYRRDVLGARGLAPPRSWEELAGLALAWTNGTLRDGGSGGGGGGTARRQALAPVAPQPRYGLCIDDAPSCTVPLLLSAILASMAQLRGPATGWYLDPSPASPQPLLINSTALMGAALALYKRLREASPAGLACLQPQSLFAAGDCLMTIAWGGPFKAMNAARNSPVRGKLGVALVPGSAQVLDRGSGAMVPAQPSTCWDAAAAVPSGSVSSVACRAPFIAYGGTFAAINAGVDEAAQRQAYRFASYLAASHSLWNASLDPNSTVEPVRSQALTADGSSLWVAAGWDAADVAAFQAAESEALASRNVAFEVHAPAAHQLRAHLDSAVREYLGGAPVAQVTAALAERWVGEWLLRGYSTAQVQAISRSAMAALQQQAEQLDPVEEQGGGASKHGGGGSALPAWAIVVIVVGSCLLAAGALVLSVHYGLLARLMGRGAAFGRILPPPAGPETSLVVTDIESSTSLWEALASDVMDSAIAQHHALARRLMLKHRGYESATEGDSFIIAFFRSDDAACFCARFQLDLMALPWPHELLAMPGCEPLWMARAEPEPVRRQRMVHIDPLDRAPTGTLYTGCSGTPAAARLAALPGSGSRLGTPTRSATQQAQLQAAAAGTPGSPQPNLHDVDHEGSPRGGNLAGLPPRLRSVPAGTAGALGATPRQLSFIARSASRAAGSPVSPGAGNAGPPPNTFGSHPVSPRPTPLERSTTTASVFRSGLAGNSLAGGAGSPLAPAGSAPHHAHAQHGLLRPPLQRACSTRHASSPAPQLGAGGGVAPVLPSGRSLRRFDSVGPHPLPRTDRSLRVSFDEQACLEHLKQAVGLPPAPGAVAAATLEPAAGSTTTNSRAAAARPPAVLQPLGPPSSDGTLTPREVTHPQQQQRAASSSLVQASGLAAAMALHGMRTSGAVSVSEFGMSSDNTTAMQSALPGKDSISQLADSGDPQASSPPVPDPAHDATTPTSPTDPAAATAAFTSPPLSPQPGRNGVGGVGALRGGGLSLLHQPPLAGTHTPPRHRLSGASGALLLYDEERQSVSEFSSGRASTIGGGPSLDGSSQMPPPLLQGAYNKSAPQLQAGAELDEKLRALQPPLLLPPPPSMPGGYAGASARRGSAGMVEGGMPGPVMMMAAAIAGRMRRSADTIYEGVVAQGSAVSSSAVNSNAGDMSAPLVSVSRSISHSGADSGGDTSGGDVSAPEPEDSAAASAPVRGRSDAASGTTGAGGAATSGATSAARAHTSGAGTGAAAASAAGTGVGVGVGGATQSASVLLPAGVQQALASSLMPKLRRGSMPEMLLPPGSLLGPAASVSGRAAAGPSKGLLGLVGLQSPRLGGHLLPPGPATGLSGRLAALAAGAGGGAPALDSRMGSMSNMMRLASQHNLQSVGDSLCTKWRQVSHAEPGAQLVFRGLRVRCGIHAGLRSASDVSLNRALNRIQYGGPGLQTAKAVADCAHGGQVLISGPAFMQLAVESLKEQIMVLHMGEHRLKDELPPGSLYCGCPRALQGRMPLLRSVRSKQQHSLGVLEAPAGTVAIVFVHVVGALSLLDWHAELAHTALSMFRDHCTLELMKFGGYLVEAVDGLVLASFSSVVQGLRWVAKSQQDMTMLPWPQELLAHESCEELCHTRVDSVSGAASEVVLFRGLRLKAGIDAGRLRGEINCITGRMSYRGRVMNRAARIVAAAGTGQILASAEAWVLCSGGNAARLLPNISATPMGQFQLKGVAEPIEIFHIKTHPEVLSTKRATLMLSSGADVIDLDDVPIGDPAVAHHHTTTVINSVAPAPSQPHPQPGVLHQQLQRSTSLHARLMHERMERAASGGLPPPPTSAGATLTRPEDSGTGFGRQSHTLSSHRSSRRSSRRSSVNSQFSALAASTMVTSTACAPPSAGGANLRVSAPSMGPVDYLPPPPSGLFSSRSATAPGTAPAPAALGVGNASGGAAAVLVVALQPLSRGSASHGGRPSTELVLTGNGMAGVDTDPRSSDKRSSNASSHRSAPLRIIGLGSTARALAPGAAQEQHGQLGGTASAPSPPPQAPPQPAGQPQQQHARFRSHANVPLVRHIGQLIRGALGPSGGHGSGASTSGPQPMVGMVGAVAAAPPLPDDAAAAGAPQQTPPDGNASNGRRERLRELGRQPTMAALRAASAAFVRPMSFTVMNRERAVGRPSDVASGAAGHPFALSPFGEGRPSRGGRRATFSQGPLALGLGRGASTSASHQRPFTRTSGTTAAGMRRSGGQASAGAGSSGMRPSSAYLPTHPASPLADQQQGGAWRGSNTNHSPAVPHSNFVIVVGDSDDGDDADVDGDDAGAFGVGLMLQLQDQPSLGQVAVDAAAAGPAGRHAAMVSDDGSELDEQRGGHLMMATMD